MPYAIRKRGSKFVVVSQDSGRVLGTHPSKAKAESQLRALYANVPDAKKGGKKKK